MGGGATNVFQSKLKRLFVVKNSQYLSSKFVGKIRVNVVVGVWPVEGVDGGDSDSGNDMEVTDVISIGLFTNFGSPCKNDCVIKC